jgi:hypothetical protein
MIAFSSTSNGYVLFQDISKRNTQTIMCDQHLESAETRVPSVVLQRNETFSVLRDSTVSDVYMHAQMGILYT